MHIYLDLIDDLLLIDIEISFFLSYLSFEIIIDSYISLYHILKFQDIYDDIHQISFRKNDIIPNSLYIYIDFDSRT